MKARPLARAFRSGWQWLRLQNYDVRVRYAPVVRAIRSLPESRGWRILDVGSGSSGIAPFLPEFTVFGADTVVALPVALPFVRASADRLPFADAAFDVVTCVDVLEHVPPARREALWSELLRVSRHLAVVAFPFGSGAAAADRSMAAAYEKAGQPAPDWLAEHLQHPHPEMDAASAVLEGAAVQKRIRHLDRSFNESLALQRVHRWLARTWVPAYKAFSVLCSLALPLLPAPRSGDKAYRCVFVVRLGSPHPAPPPRTRSLKGRAPAEGGV